MSISVLIVDDKAAFRHALRLMLELEDGIAVVGEAGDGAEALARARSLRPDVVLMDLRMPVMGGIESTRAIHGELTDTKIVILTVSDDQDDVVKAVKAGAIGYLLKEVSVEEVADAVRAVAGGKSLISPSIASSLMEEFLPSDAVPSPSHPASSQLDSRELEVLRGVSLGRSNEQIAGAMGVTEETVRRHVANILLKLQMRARIDEAVASLRDNLQDTGDLTR